MRLVGRAHHQLVRRGPVGAVGGGAASDGRGGASVEPDLLLLAVGLERQPLPVGREQRLVSARRPGNRVAFELVRAADVEDGRATGLRYRIDQPCSVGRDRRRPRVAVRHLGAVGAGVAEPDRGQLGGRRGAPEGGGRDSERGDCHGREAEDHGVPESGARPAGGRGCWRGARPRRRPRGGGVRQCLGEQRRRGEPVGRQLLERGEHRRFDMRRNRVALREEGAGVLGHDPGHDRLGGRAGERRISREHLVQHGAQRVYIRARRDLSLAHRLLGTHVVRRAERHAGFSHPGAARLARGQSYAEVGHERAAVVEQDVLRLDVPVDHAVAVGVVERRGHLARDAHRVGHGELLLATQPIAQRLTFDVRHHIEQERVGLTRVEQRQDVRVLEVGGELDLGQEALGADDGRELGAQHLHRHPPIVPQVLGEIHRGHAARADLVLEAVMAGQGTRDPRRQAAHGASWRDRAGERVVGMLQDAVLCGRRRGAVATPAGSNVTPDAARPSPRERRSAWRPGREPWRPPLHGSWAERW